MSELRRDHFQLRDSSFLSIGISNTSWMLDNGDMIGAEDGFESVLGCEIERDGWALTT